MSSLIQCILNQTIMTLSWSHPQTFLNLLPLGMTAMRFSPALLTLCRRSSPHAYMTARTFLVADCVALPELIAAKVMLYQGMQDQSIGKAELARRLGWTLTQVDRATDINHRSRLDDMDAALRAVGC